MPFDFEAGHIAVRLTKAAQVDLPSGYTIIQHQLPAVEDDHVLTTGVEAPTRPQVYLIQHLWTDRALNARSLTAGRAIQHKQASLMRLQIHIPAGVIRGILGICCCSTSGLQIPLFQRTCQRCDSDRCLTPITAVVHHEQFEAIMTTAAADDVAALGGLISLQRKTGFQ